jgi:hypothetical protein
MTHGGLLLAQDLAAALIVWMQQLVLPPLRLEQP